MLEVTTKPAEENLTAEFRGYWDKAESEFSNSRRKLTTGQMFESRGIRLVRETVGSKSAKLY